MKNKIRLLLFIFLIISRIVIAQECAMFELAKDFKSNPELKELLKDNSKHLNAWMILLKEKPSLRTSVREVKLVSKNIKEIKELGGYVTWKLFLDKFGEKKWEEFSKFFTDNKWSQADKKLFVETFGATPTIENAKNWKKLKDAGSKYVFKDGKLFQKFTELDPRVQDYIIKFSDEKANSTLAKFLEDCDDVDFKAFVNNADNELTVKGFLAHKEGMLTEDEVNSLAEMLENAYELPNDKIKKWLEYGDNMLIFKTNREAGNAWGKLMKQALANPKSQAYQELKKIIPDLDEYSIYHQVEFCIKGDCLSKGNYWKPDFTLVREVQDVATNEKYIEVIIVDAKLSIGTAWTPNQKVAQHMSGWKVKSVAPNPIKGNNISGFMKNNTVNKKGTFIKLFNDKGVPKTK